MRDERKPRKKRAAFPSASCASVGLGGAPTQKAHSSTVVRRDGASSAPAGASCLNPKRTQRAQCKIGRTMQHSSSGTVWWMRLARRSVVSVAFGGTAVRQPRESVLSLL